MHALLKRWLSTVVLACAAVALPAAANPLVNVAWLQERVGSADLLVIDTSPAKLYAAGHIPGARHVDLYAAGMHLRNTAQIEALLQSWGVSESKHVVLYDQGATMNATWLFYDLYQLGFPAEKLSVLDGGFAKWKAAGATVETQAAPLPAKGDFRALRPREEVRVRLPEFLLASGDRASHALVEAMEPEYHYGDAKFFAKAGHVPHAVMWPVADFFNADKTFKSAAEIRRMAAFLGVKPEQKIHSHCGGGIAATVPFFALKFIADYPQVAVYKESHLGWLRDERGLPFWTYDAPYLKRDLAYVSGWGSRMMRMYDVAQMSVLDVRPAEAYAAGHVPYAINVPAEVFRRHLQEPAKLGALLGPAGVDSNHEAVILSAGGVTPDAALTFVALERLGQKKVSLVMEPVEEWGFQGMQLTKEPTVVGRPKSPQELAVAPAVYAAEPRNGIVAAKAPPAHGYPRVYLASGKALPARAVEGKVVHVPYTDLLKADGSPKPAAEMWKVLAKAGLPRYAEIVTIADEPGEAAANYYLLRLMGMPDVKVQL
jgi:thiosulfate/3-mercaptopyruvate sulfurtransferase